MIKEGTKVKIYPKENDIDFLNKYNARVGTVKCVNPIAGYEGYEVSVWDFDETINLDVDEVIEART